MQIAIELLPENFPLILKMTDLEKDVVWNMYRSAIEEGEEMYVVVNDDPNAKHAVQQMNQKMLWKTYKTKLMSTIYNVTEKTPIS